MPVFERDGLSFHYRDEGQGLPFVFQHGLGGDSSQPCGCTGPRPESGCCPSTSAATARRIPSGTRRG